MSDLRELHEAAGRDTLAKTPMLAWGEAAWVAYADGSLVERSELDALYEWALRVWSLDGSPSVNAHTIAMRVITLAQAAREAVRDE